MPSQTSFQTFPAHPGASREYRYDKHKPTPRCLADLLKDVLRPVGSSSVWGQGVEAVQRHLRLQAHGDGKHSSSAFWSVDAHVRQGFCFDFVPVIMSSWGRGSCDMLRPAAAPVPGMERYCGERPNCKASMEQAR